MSAAVQWYRYRLWLSGVQMVPDDEGDWVRFSDVEDQLRAAQEERDALRAERAMSDERAEAIAAKLNRSVAAALDKALAEVATLRASLAASEAAREQLQDTLAAVYGVPGVVEILAARVSEEAKNG